MPYRCPVCNGHATVQQGFYDHAPVEGAYEKCRTCNGTGIVWGASWAPRVQDPPSWPRPAPAQPIWVVDPNSTNPQLPGTTWCGRGS